MSEHDVTPEPLPWSEQARRINDQAIAAALYRAEAAEADLARLRSEIERVAKDSRFAEGWCESEAAHGNLGAERVLEVVRGVIGLAALARGGEPACQLNSGGE